MILLQNTSIDSNLFSLLVIDTCHKDHFDTQLFELSNLISILGFIGSIVEHTDGLDTKVIE